MKNSKSNTLQLVEEINSINDELILSFINAELAPDIMNLFEQLIISNIFWGNYFLSIKNKVNTVLLIPIDQNYTYKAIMSYKIHLDTILRRFLIYSKKCNTKNNIRINELLYKTLKIGEELLSFPEKELNYFIIKSHYSNALRLYIEIIEKIELFNSTIQTNDTFSLLNQHPKRNLKYIRKIQEINSLNDRSILYKNNK